MSDRNAATGVDADSLESGLSNRNLSSNRNSVSAPLTSPPTDSRSSFKRRVSRQASILATADLVGPSSSDVVQQLPRVPSFIAGDGQQLETAKTMEAGRPSRLFSKSSMKDAITSAYDSWRKHDIWLALLMLLGAVGGVALATLTHLSSGAIVPSEDWFNGLHIAVGLIAGVLGHWGERVAVSAARTYFASALLGDDGVALKHVVEVVNGSTISALKGLFGDRSRLKQERDHATMGRRPNSLKFTATTGAVIGLMMPILHVVLILGSKFTPTTSDVTGFQCDVPDYRLSRNANFSTQWITGADLYLTEVRTDSFASQIGTESYLAACHDVDGHLELQEFRTHEIVQALHFKVECEDTVLLGSATYTGENTQMIGRTDFSMEMLGATCTLAFCQLNTIMYGYGENATMHKCVVSTQAVTTTGYADFIRVGLAGLVCSNFDVDPEGDVMAPDLNFAALWSASVVTLNETTGRWPRGSWMGGLAFELPMDPPFDGYMPPDYAEHIITRLFGGMHQLLSANYDHATQIECDGQGDIGAGQISVPEYAHAIGITFGVVAILLAVYTFSSARDIQLMVGVRNFRRAISALETPLRFAALLDRTQAMGALVDMCDETPETIEAAALKLVVAMGGDLDVSGMTGHACISTIENVDVFSPMKMYKGRPDAAALPVATAAAAEFATRHAVLRRRGFHLASKWKPLLDQRRKRRCKLSTTPSAESL
ncbi:hypothetical protein HDU87_000774 [Geranomyces variabilis]|uniref:Uncharacterized protein n=1 Tax=Geranomyces variabilis TaxID=109894 RepID=A0AAD5TNZ1_9FUNG|nr:hypothetical protein HDU87_000774 [Geranomyces variabilis]